MRLTWPLIGRTQELRTIESAISGTDVAGVVISGAEGVGKSRIAREAMSAAASRECTCRWVGGAVSARTVPLGALTEWARSGVTDTVQLVRDAIESLTAADAGPTVVVGVDDVHLLDDLSTFVIGQIVQRGAAKAVLTVRDREPVPAAVQEIWKLARFDRIDLKPLSLNEATALLETTLGGSLDPHDARRLWTLTRGNALYLRTIVEQELADGRLVHRHSYWRWTGAPTMPPGLVELIESRIGSLPTPVSEVIDALAVDEPIELTSLTRITDPAAVEEAEARGLITFEQSAGRVAVRAAHPIYGEVRRERAPATRLRRLRRLVAEELGASPDRDDIRVVVRRATLSLDTDVAPDPDLLVKAAHGAVWLADLALADHLAAAAIRAGAGPEPSFIRAHALSWLGRGEQADAMLAAIDADQLTDDERARLAFLRASNTLWALGDPARAKALIDSASDTTPPDARGYIDAFLTVYLFATDQPEAATVAAKSLTLDRLPAVVGSEVAWVLAAIAADSGATAEAIDLVEAGYTTATRSFDAPQMRFNIADAHLSALWLAGRIGDALDVSERVGRQAADLPGTAQLLGAAIAGRAALCAGHLKSAHLLLEQAAEGLSASGHGMGWGYRYHLVLATALAMRGLTEQAAAALAALDMQRRPFRSLDYERSLAHAWLTASQGAVSTAIGLLTSAAEKAAEKQQFAAEVICLQTVTQFGDAAAAPRLCELAEIVEGPRAGLAARFALALRDGDAAQLAVVSEEFEAMGDLVAAADAAALAALAYRRQDLRGSALLSSTRAGALAQRCGGACTPALRRIADNVPLTDREREIAMLIGEGLSNRDLAERLSLSVRTVESHIYHAMARTGTQSREALAALLPRPVGE